MGVTHDSQSEPAKHDDYTPSKKNGPNGPRDDEAQLGEIAKNSANFDGTQEERYGVEDTDPFSPSNAPKLSLVVQMRIYDVLLAILEDSNPESAKRLHELHAAGGILGSEPYIDLTDE